MNAKLDENVMVAIIGKDQDSSEVLSLGLKEFPSRKVILIFEQAFATKAKKISNELARQKVSTEFRQAAAITFEEIFRSMSEIRMSNENARVIINTDTDYGTNCVALSAAFVNGVQAIGLMQGKIIAYPIMKFSYYNAISDKKREVLRKIFEKREYPSLESLSKDLSMSLPLVTYHIRGSREKKGLEQLGLVATTKSDGKVAVRLTTLGNMIAKGYVDIPTEEDERK